jgi:hypothetical protein
VDPLCEIQQLLLQQQPVPGNTTSLLENRAVKQRLHQTKHKTVKEQSYQSQYHIGYLKILNTVTYYSFPQLTYTRSMH